MVTKDLVWAIVVIYLCKATICVHKVSISDSEAHMYICLGEDRFMRRGPVMTRDVSDGSELAD